MSHLFNSIAFAPSLSFNAYPSIPIAARTPDLSAPDSASCNACSYAEKEKVTIFTHSDKYHLLRHTHAIKWAEHVTVRFVHAQ